MVHGSIKMKTLSGYIHIWLPTAKYIHIWRTMNKHIFVVSWIVYEMPWRTVKQHLSTCSSNKLCVQRSTKRKATKKFVCFPKYQATTHVHCWSKRSALQIRNLLGIHKKFSKAYHFAFHAFYIMQFSKMKKIYAVSAFSQC